MNRDQSRHACADLVATLDLPRPFDLAEMCARIGGRRGRPIVLMPTAMVIGNLCGTWMSTATADYVFYEQDTSQLHQRHIVCHEIGHILLRHDAGRVLGLDVAHAVAPGISRNDVQRVLGRDCYDDEDEFGAELFATLVMRRIGREPVREAPRATEPQAAPAVARIADSLARGDA